MTLPDITHDLVRFTAQRLADVEFKDWKQLDKSVRDEHMEAARRVLRAERRFLTRQAQVG